MDLKETALILELLSNGYPNSKAYSGPQVAKSWHKLGLDDLPFDPVFKAIKTGLRDDKFGEFPPSVRDIIKAYIDTLPKLPIDYEGLADKSGVKQAINARVDKRFPEIDTKRQFRDIEAYEEAKAINAAQRTKYTNELYKEVKPKIQALMNSGLGTTKIIAEVFGLEYVRPTQKGYLGQGAKQIEDLASQLAKKLPGGA